MTQGFRCVGCGERKPNSGDVCRLCGTSQKAYKAAERAEEQAKHEERMAFAKDYPYIAWSAFLVSAVIGFLFLYEKGEGIVAPLIGAFAAGSLGYVYSKAALIIFAIGIISLFSAD